tara:strand:- start:1399 stop:1653 length:255 start_codon:yes stop_codon:yes gene_type:complete
MKIFNSAACDFVIVSFSSNHPSFVSAASNVSLSRFSADFVDRLREFTQMPALKRMALLCVAHQLADMSTDPTQQAVHFKFYLQF